MAEFLTNNYIIERIKNLHDDFNKDNFNDKDYGDIDIILDKFTLIFGNTVPIVDTKHTHYPLTTLYGMTYDNVESVLPIIIDAILYTKNLDGSKKNSTKGGGGQAILTKLSSSVKNGVSDLSSVKKYFSWSGNAAGEAKHNLARILYFIALDNCDGIRSIDETTGTLMNINEMYKIISTKDNKNVQMVPIRIPDIPDEKKLRLLLFYIASTIADNDIEGDIMDYNPVFRFYEDLFEIRNREEVNTTNDNALLITTKSIIESFNTTTLTLKGIVNNTVDLRLIQSILCGHIILYKKDKQLLLEKMISRLRGTVHPLPDEESKIDPIDESIVKKYVDEVFKGIEVDKKVKIVVSALLTKYGNDAPAQPKVAAEGRV